MAVYQLDVEKEINGEYWTNTYFVNALEGFTEAIGIAGVVTDAERTFHGTLVRFTKYRLSIPGEADDRFYTEPINAQGLLGLSEYLPLFNTVRVDFPAGFGRPYRKFYRGCIDEATTNGGQINIASATAVALLSALGDIAGLIARKNGDFLGQGTIYPRIQMRQLRRGTRRRKNPILP